MNTESLHDGFRHSDPELWLSERDIALHERAIERMRRQLFRQYRPERYFIIPESETVDSPFAYYNHHASGERTLCLGGLRFRIESPRPGAWYEACLRHASTDLFNFWLVVHHSGQVYTRFAIAERFQQIDVVMRECIDALRAEDSQFLKH